MLSHAWEGFWFALGFFPLYKTLDVIADYILERIPIMYRKRQSDAAKRLRAAQLKTKLARSGVVLPPAPVAEDLSADAPPHTEIEVIPAAGRNFLNG